MRYLFVPALACLIIVQACESRAGEGNDSPSGYTPSALQDNKSSELKISKRAPTDLVEELYDEIESESVALKQLAEKIEQVNQQELEVIKPFQNFNSKNGLYYDNTHRHIQSIRDTALRNQMQRTIETSLQHYKSRSQSYESLIRQLSEKHIRLDDLHTVLKLVKTLSAMENFQKTGFPPLGAMQQVSRDYDNVMKETEKLTRE